MTQTLCDKCHRVIVFNTKVYKPVVLKSFDLTNSIFDDGDSEAKVADLCGSCFEALKGWLSHA